ncbi:glutamate racemase [Endozoicomonas sp. (ex Bugula neritina AB1)]|nr:glutamate racemase [Endozoicomonas sp. (ex Bugula neritina AB1)]
MNISFYKSPTSFMPKQVRPIVIFDSGVGGLSIYQEIKRALPDLNIVYCSDTAAFPYGSKSEKEVIDRTSYCLSELAKQYQPLLAVIACNTASTISLPRVRAELNFPVVGVVPAIKMASKLSINRCIGLLATPGTIERDYTDQLINEFADDCRVIRVGSSELVYLAEQHLRGELLASGVLEQIIAPFFEHVHYPDTIVLGCTHFPLLKNALDSVTPQPVQWVDSGTAIARRVLSLLEHHLPFEATRDIFVHTGGPDSIKALVPALGDMGFDKTVLLN